MIKGDALNLEFFMNYIPIFLFVELIVELSAVRVCVEIAFVSLTNRSVSACVLLGPHLPVRNILDRFLILFHPVVCPSVMRGWGSLDQIECTELRRHGRAKVAPFKLCQTTATVMYGKLEKDAP